MAIQTSVCFSLTRLRHPHNLANTSTYRETDVGSIYLIRHGGHPLVPTITTCCRRSAFVSQKLLGAHIARTNFRFDRCITGSLRRQQHTAELTLGQLDAAGLKTPELEIDPAFNEFDAESVIRALLPTLENEPEALHVMRNAAQHRAEFQRLFSIIVSLAQR